MLINSAIFIAFAFSFTRPKTARDWRSLGGFSAFVLALFTEMYGFPLTIFLLSGWLTKRFPGIDIYSHESGHLWSTLIDWNFDPHADPLHISSNVLLVAGFMLLAASWRVLHPAQREGHLACKGPYAWVRHPQYVAFIVLMLAFLLQWPTLPTVVMFPILLLMYYRLARREEQEALATLGEEYSEYMQQVPAFLPKLFPLSKVTSGKLPNG